VAGGAQLRLGFDVVGVSRVAGETRVRAASGEELAFDRLVVCGGLQSDRLARLVGDAPAPRIVPFRGEYYRLLPERSELVRGLIYPVPDPRYPFLGVHFTRRIGGSVDVGPNAVLALAREGYRRRDLAPRELAELLRSRAFRRLARRHWRMGVHELHGSLSKRAYVAQARSFVPELRIEDVVPAPAGIRAQAVDDDGELVDDFRISDRDGTLVVRNAPSPAATSSLAIAEYVVERLGLGGHPVAAAGDVSYRSI
jgi:L-2-hydroxyglutarate oxidase LhgO